MIFIQRRHFLIQVPAPPDPNGGTPGPVRKKSNSCSSVAETASPEVSSSFLLKIKLFFM